MADENVGSSTSFLEHPWSIGSADPSPADELGQPLERNCGRLHIVVRGGLHGSTYQSVCSVALGERLQLGTPIHRFRRDPDHSISS
jgi:hypothetical protein